MPVVSHFFAAAPQLRVSFQSIPTCIRRIHHSIVRPVLCSFRNSLGRGVCSDYHLTSSSCALKKLSLPVRMPRSSRRTASTSAIEINETGVLKAKRALKRDLDAHCTPRSELRDAASKKVKQEDQTTSAINAVTEVQSSLLTTIKVEGVSPQDSVRFVQSLVGVDTCDEKVEPISITKRQRSAKVEKESGNETINAPDTIAYTRRRKQIQTEPADVDSVPSLQPAEGKLRGKTTKSSAPVTQTVSPSRNKRSRPSKAEPEAQNTAIPAPQPDQLALLPKLEPADVIASTPAATAVVIKPVPSGSPFPDFVRPYPEECREVTRRLAVLHGWEIEDNRACPTLPPDQEESLRSTPSGAETAGMDSESKLELVLPIEVASGKPAGSQVEVSEDVLFPGSDSARESEVPREEDEGREGGQVVQVVLEKAVAGLARFGVLDSLVRTILSQNTTDKNASRAYAALKTAFPSWEEVHAADPAHLESAIRCGGLAEIKGRRIQEILATLQAERGALSLEYLHEMSTDQIKAELGRFKGVGPKTVFRITKSLGWVPPTADRERTYLHLNQRIPDDCKYALHCLLVTHGKHCPNCAKKWAQRASVGPCPLVSWGKEHIKYRGMERLGEGDKLLAIEG